MKAIVFDKIGLPSDVLELRDVPIPEIGDNEVLVKMLSASINPGDFLFIQSLYPEPKKPHLPGQIAGTVGGVGVIAEVGKRVSFKPGTIVAFGYYNQWAEYAAVPAEWLMPLSGDYPLEKASQFSNFISAWDLLELSGVRAGQWLALTAGNSALATMILQMAKVIGINVVSIVRKAQEDLDLKTLGASEVIELSKNSEDISGRIKEITENKGIDGVIDCVGGSLLGQLIQSVAMGAKVIVYGGFSADKFELHNFDVLMKVMEIKSYAYRYFFDPPRKEDADFLKRIAEISGRPDFKIRIAGIHALEDFKTAVEETVHRPERGKRFFRMSAM
ncbi:MAG: hypothetical protein QOH96_1625 [Blastocatellia bacterium]|jgi:NADPH:quinone reductase-like Zn-dependent oxidoreductase|nr:hypothetical protein [Blastocatellia bacterium]